MCEKGSVLPRESRRLTERPTKRPPPASDPTPPPQPSLTVLLVAPPLLLGRLPYV